MIADELVDARERRNPSGSVTLLGRIGAHEAAP
jgi:hypothetical protein